MFKHIRIFCLTLFVTVLASVGASATPVAYIFRGDVTGSLDGNAVDGLLTLTVTGDTDDVVDNGNGAFIGAIVSTFELAGIGLFTVTNASYAFVNQEFSKMGFGVMGLASCCDIIQHQVSDYAAYDLMHSIGPIAADENLSLGAWKDVPTTAGLFTLTRMTDNTFEAVVAAEVPEPGSLALVGVAGATALLVARRRRWALLRS